MDKVITIKNGDEVVHEFVITETELNIAEKLGIDHTKYITEKVRAELKEKNSE